MMMRCWFDSPADPQPVVWVGMQQHLILVPTELERGRIEPVVTAAHGVPVRFDLCGFGAVVAAARTAGLIAERRPERVLLLGIAGCYADRLAIGRSGPVGVGRRPLAGHFRAAAAGSRRSHASSHTGSPG